MTLPVLSSTSQLKSVKLILLSLVSSERITLEIDAVTQTENLCEMTAVNKLAQGETGLDLL